MAPSRPTLRIRCQCLGIQPLRRHVVRSRTVDDYGSIEPTTSAHSGFESFELINSVLGFHMKKSKRQPPDKSRRIQGVIITCDDKDITVSPRPDRVLNITKQLQQHLDSNAMSPEQARKLAGKRSFTTTQLFGRVGRAALRALYNKAFSNISHINTSTHNAIIALIDILQHCQHGDFHSNPNQPNSPSSIPMHSTVMVTNRYAALIYLETRTV